MKKIVILGCENSHANMFLGFIKDNPEYKDIKVIGVFSEDLEASNKLSKEFGVNVMETFDQEVGNVDGIIVTARHGKNHYKYAKPYIASGIPMFIDKPVTVDTDQAIKFMKECKEAGVVLTGGSSCVHDKFVQELKKDVAEKVDGETLGGYVVGPVSVDNPYGGFFFYSDHLISITAEIFGRYPKSVKADVKEKTVTVNFNYGEFNVTTLFTIENAKNYYALRCSENSVKASELSINTSSYVFEREFKEFNDILKGAKQRLSYKDFIATVFIMNAIYRSMQTGEEVEIKEYEV